VSSDQVTSPEAAPPKSNRRFVLLGLVIVAVLVLDFVAALVVPPFPAGGQSGEACAFPTCFITSTLELPPPRVVIDLDPSQPMPTGSVVITFHPSITNTLLTMWIVSVILLVVAFLATRVMRLVPGGLQNLVEFAYESLENFGIGMGGAAAKPYIPLFVAFFLLILFCNWSGLIPPVGRLDQFRAPTSDVNITLGLALVSFIYFEFQGFKHNGVGGYMARFFPFYEFRNGVGAGIIALFVGLIELMLEFVKPVTLSMRLFGNIYGGEVALAAITALTIAVLPVAMLGLEFLLNFIQALIFSILTLMFITLAIESHEGEEGELGHEAADAIEHPRSAGQPVAA
jgi:F-type H+-transporting ATPase subunit a